MAGALEEKEEKGEDKKKKKKKRENEELEAKGEPTPILGTHSLAKS